MEPVISGCGARNWSMEPVIGGMISRSRDPSRAHGLHGQKFRARAPMVTITGSNGNSVAPITTSLDKIFKSRALTVDYGLQS